MDNKVLNDILTNPRYKIAECVGDSYLKEKVNFYLEKREKLLSKKNINKERFLYYENKLIKDDWKTWWCHYTKNYLNVVLWFLKRLVVNQTPLEEYKLLQQFYSRLPVHIRKYGLKGMDNLGKDEELLDYFAKSNINL